MVVCLQEFRGREKAQLTLWDFWGLEQPTGDLGCCGRQSTQSFSYGRNIMWLASIPQSHWATHSWCVGSPAACALGGPWILHIWRELLLYLKELRDTLLLQASKWRPGTWDIWGWGPVGEFTGLVGWLFPNLFSYLTVESLKVNAPDFSLSSQFLRHQ